MLHYVTPHLRLDSVLDLGPERLRELGLLGLLLDLDNTLKDHGAPTIPPDVVEWSHRLRAAGISLCLLSNGRPGRVGRLAAGLGIACVPKAFKPLPFGCRAGVRRLGLEPRSIGVVGDQLFADVLAGRLAGLTTILVRPTSPNEPWFTRLKRPPERWVLRRLGKGAIFAAQRPDVSRPSIPAKP